MENNKEARPNKPWYKKWWGVAAIVIVIVWLLATFGPEKQNSDPMTSSIAAPTPPKANLISKKGVGVVYAMTLEEPYPSYIVLDNHARKTCAGQNLCEVHGYNDASRTPTAWPMTDRELESLIFSYSINRPTGFEQSLAKCDTIKDTPKDKCS